jgi:hypothetical protein
MKAVLTIVVLLFPLVCMAQCPTLPDERGERFDNWRFRKVIGNVKRVRWSLYGGYIGSSIERRTEGLDTNWHFVDSFGPTGNKLRSYIVDRGVVVEWHEYKFDAEGTLIEERSNDNGKVDVLTIFTDGETKNIAELQYYCNGNLCGDTKYTYDKTGKNTEQKFYSYHNGNRDLDKTVKYTYVSPTITIKEDSTPEALPFRNQRVEKFVYKCNDKRKVIEENIILHNGYPVTIEFGYDNKGNRVFKKEIFPKAKRPYSLTTIYKYDQGDNEVLKEEHYDDGDVTTRYISEYTYDSHGNWVRKLANYVPDLMVAENPSVVREIEYY